MQFKIYKASMDDAPGIAGVLRELGWFDPINTETETETTERVRRHLRLCLKDDSHSVFVAKSPDGTTFGYASAHWNPYLFLPGLEGYISELFVQPEHRGQGIGTQLLKTIEQEARQRNCYRLMLINNRTRKSYLLGFYGKNGWEERPQMANFILKL